MQGGVLADVGVQFLPREHVGFIKNRNRLAKWGVGNVFVYGLYLMDTATQGAAAQPLDSANLLDGGLGNAISKGQLKILLQVRYEGRHLLFPLLAQSRRIGFINTL